MAKVKKKTEKCSYFAGLKNCFNNSDRMEPFDLYSSSCSKDMNLINEISDGTYTTDFGESVNDGGELTMIDEES